jgi:hypothetical protein
VSAATYRETIAIARGNAWAHIEVLIRRLLDDAEEGPARSGCREVPPGVSRDHRIRKVDEEIASLRAQLADTEEHARIKRRLDEILALRAAIAAIDAGERGDA